MLFIFVATPKEAKPIIDVFNLKKDNKDKYFSIYKDISENQSSSEVNIILTITGIGNENCALAVGFLAGKYPISKNDIFVNIGIAAGNKSTDIGDIFQINKIHSIDSDRDYYPFIYENYFNEVEIITGSTVQEEISESSANILLYDMESEGFFISASHFATPDKIIILKAVSDHGIKHKDIRHNVETAIGKLDDEKIINYILYLKKMSLETDEEKQAENKKYNKLFEDLKCSESMKEELKKLMKYSLKAKVDFDKEINALYELNYIPVTSRKEGKIILNKIKKDILKAL